MSKRAPLFGPFGRKLFITLALLSLLMVSAVGVAGYRQARSALRESAMQRMEDMARERGARLDAWFDERMDDLGQLALLIERDLADGQADLENLMRPHLGREGAYRRMLVLDGAGSVLSETGSRHADCPLPSDDDLSLALASDAPSLGAVAAGPRGIPIAHLSAPLLLADGHRGLLLAVMHPAETLYPILADTTGLGRTGETYLVDADTLMLSPSRHMNHPPEFTHKMPTPGVHACLAGATGSELYMGFLGDEVLGAYVWMPRQRWALMAEIHAAEAFAPLSAMARQTLALALITLLGALVLSALLSRGLARPVNRLAAASARVAAGDRSRSNLPEGRDELGRLSAAFNTMVDELARHERELLHAERLAAVGRLAAGVVHEMRNPLSALKMNLSALARRKDLSEIEREQLAIARAQGDRLERMLDELLDYSRPVELNRKNLDARTLLQSCAEQLRGEAGDAKVELIVEEGSAALDADPEILLRALVNLAANALQASQKGGRVRLKAETEGSATLLQVTDQGRGMSERQLKRLFNPFFTTREEGTGLGMSNARKCVEAHGGRLEVNSEEGRGTVARIYLPLTR
ncbi:sensor histidine kinase [bacterium]|nr:sensor histidine kinase [bacterium]